MKDNDCYLRILFSKLVNDIAQGKETSNDWIEREGEL